MIISKKHIKWAILLSLLTLSIFLSIYFGIKSYNLSLEEMAEQIEKVGYYKSDIYINLERQKLLIKYGFLATAPTLMTTCLLIGNYFIDKTEKE